MAKAKERVYSVLDIVAILSYMAIGIFLNNKVFYNFDEVMWGRIGQDLLRDFSNIGRETISWAYEAGVSDIWINHEFLTTMIMGLCNYVAPWLFGLICCILIFSLQIVEYTKARKYDFGGHITKIALSYFMFGFLMSMTGYARPVGLNIIVMIMFLRNLNSYIYLDGKKRGLIIESILLVLWACTHGGSYPISLVIIGCLAFEEVINREEKGFINRVKNSKSLRVCIVYAITTGALLLFKITRNSILYNFVQHANTEIIKEWKSLFELGKEDIGTLLFMFCIIIASIVVLVFCTYNGAKSIKKNIGLYILLAGTLVMGILHMRYLQYYGIIGFSLIARYSGELKKEKESLRIFADVTLIVCSIMMFSSGLAKISNQYYNIYDIYDNLRESKTIDYSEEYLDKLTECKGYKLINTNSTLNDFLLEHDIMLYFDGRVDNFHEDACNNIDVLINLANKEDKVINELEKVRGIGADFINIRRPSELNEDDFLKVVRTGLGGKIEIVAKTEETGYKYIEYLIKLE